MKATVEIQNLKCGGCGNTIKNKLSELDNISNVVIGLEDSTVSFEYRSDKDFELVKNVLLKIGYPLIGEDNKLQTKAKSYVSCAIGRMSN